MFQTVKQLSRKAAKVQSQEKSMPRRYAIALCYFVSLRETTRLSRKAAKVQSQEKERAPILRERPLLLCVSAGNNALASEKLIEIAFIALMSHYTRLPFGSILLL